MIVHALALLAAAAAPQIQNRNFDSLAGWTAHRHGDAPQPPAVRAENHMLVIGSDGGERAGVSQTVWLTPGTIWRLSAKTNGGFLEAETPSGSIGRSAKGEMLFRVPSPGEVTIHLDNAGEGTAPPHGEVTFSGVLLDSVSEPDPGELRIRLDTAGRPLIDVKQQGQFIEMLCRLIPSMLAQQVDDDSFEGEPPYHVSYIQETDRPHRPWYPEGAVQTADYTLDTSDAFNGKRSERITIHMPNARAGIAQDGFYIRKDTGYRLRLHMRGSTALPVRAVLRDARGDLAPPANLGNAAAAWSPAEALLRPTRDSDAATLVIEFDGAGTLWLDRVYLVGNDAVDGLWRPDVVEALRELKPGVIRFGGTSVEGYDWTQGIGSWDKRTPFTTYWGGLEPNFVGIEEFVRLCRLVGAEPMICVRWTGKQPADAAAEVEYMNGAADTRWGRERAANGHPRPYGVKYWQIGNEVGDPGYERSVGAFARAMREADPSIKLLSSYPRPDLLERAGGLLDYLCPHHYGFGDMTEVVDDFEALRKQIEAQPKGRAVRVAVTEWNTTGGDFGLKRGILQSLGNALDCSRYHNLLLRYADLVEMGIRSNLIDSFGSGVILTGPGWIYRAPTYYAEQLYGRAAGSYSLQVEHASDLPWQLRQPDVSAALSPDGSLLRIYAVNSTPRESTPVFALSARNARAAGAAAFVLKNNGPASTEAMNSPSGPRAVSVITRSVAAAGNRFRVDLDPYSLTLLEIRLAR